MSPDHRTLLDLLEGAAERPGFGLRFLDRFEGETWLEWSEIRVRALETCGKLQAAGVARRDRVALVYPTRPEFFDAFLGVLLAGAVPVPLYPPFRLGRLDEYYRRTARMIELASARMVLADTRVRRMLGEVTRIARPPLGCRTLEELAPGPPSVASPSIDELALVQFSSGTTVDPKPVALSHRAVVSQAATLNRFWPDDGETVHSGVSWLPLYHDMGLVGCVFPAMERPAHLTLIPSELFIARPACWLRAISRYRATVSPAPNFAYSLCVSRVRDDQLEGVDLSSWRVALNGAETVVPSVVRAFHERFGRWGLRADAMTPVYGMSEASLAVTFSSPFEPAHSLAFDRDELARHRRAVPRPDGLEIVSVGRPLPGFEVRVADNGEPRLPERHVGRVIVRGPSIMDGYLDQPEATAAVLQDGWLDTGDLGFQHEGNLYLTGRAKDLLILRGRNHAPEEVEQAVADVSGVRAGCTVAASRLPEDADGEVLLLFVETRFGLDSPEARDLQRRCAEAVLGATALATERVIVLEPGTLPRTSSGKLRRQDTLRRYLAGELHAPEPVNAVRIAGAVARSTLAFARMRWARSDPPTG